LALRASQFADRLLLRRAQTSGRSSPHPAVKPHSAFWNSSRRGSGTPTRAGLWPRGGGVSGLVRGKPGATGRGCGAASRRHLDRNTTAGGCGRDRQTALGRSALHHLGTQPLAHGEGRQNAGSCGRGQYTQSRRIRVLPREKGCKAHAVPCRATTTLRPTSVSVRKERESLEPVIRGGLSA
jgi:hypothetical protein